MFLFIENSLFLYDFNLDICCEICAMKGIIYILAICCFLRIEYALSSFEPTINLEDSEEDRSVEVSGTVLFNNKISSKERRTDGSTDEEDGGKIIFATY